MDPESPRHSDPHCSVGPAAGSKKRLRSLEREGFSVSKPKSKPVRALLVRFHSHPGYGQHALDALRARMLDVMQCLAFVRLC